MIARTEASDPKPVAEILVTHLRRDEGGRVTLALVHPSDAPPGAGAVPWTREDVLGAFADGRSFAAAHYVGGTWVHLEPIRAAELDGLSLPPF